MGVDKERNIDRCDRCLVEPKPVRHFSVDVLEEMLGEPDDAHRVLQTSDFFICSECMVRVSRSVLITWMLGCSISESTMSDSELLQTVVSAGHGLTRYGEESKGGADG